MHMTLSESETIEFKKSTSELKEAIISIAAMLNKHGESEVYFGVRDNGVAIGQDVSDKTLRDISRQVSDNVEPKVYPKIEKAVVDGKDCIKVVFAGGEAPYFAFGRAYLRVGTENRPMSQAELKKLFMAQRRGLWETQLSEKTTGDVDVKIIRAYMQKANESKRILHKFTDMRSTLDKLHVLKGEKLLNAGQVLFCDDSNLEVQVAVFAGTDKLTFLDIQTFTGSIFGLLEKSESYLKEHMNWRADLSGRQRVEIPEVPIRALAEALVNSLCHRDYMDSKGNEIAIFKDRIEIYNPGQFPEEVKIENYLEGKERSILRNPIIAHVLFLSKDIEEWGSGLKRIQDECRASNVKVEFETLKTGFLVTFYRKGELPQNKGVDKGVDKGVEMLSGTELKIIELVKQQPAISKQGIMGKGSLSKKTVEYNIQKLKSKGLLRRVGPDNGGYWEVVV